MSTAPTPSRRLTPRMTIAIFLALFGLLALGYFLFLRAEYVPIFAQMRPAEASAVVAQLEAKKIDYRLADGGTTILARSDQADQARLAIAGSAVGLKGGVGFELFNKSDMGLTDFAQRINYQRALQGELERSIMMIDEVESARVHLALPERAIFRSERSSAKAAVELVVKPGRQFDAARVTGIQQLVAFAVPDLGTAGVVVLDGNGRILSQSATDDAFLSPETEEQRGAQSYYRARARAALEQALQGVRAEVKVLALGGVTGTTDAGASEAPEAQGGATRNFRLRVIVSTAAPLNSEQTELARNAVVSALALSEAAGDHLSFQLGLISETAAPAPVPQAYPPAGQNNAVAPATPVPWFYWGFGALPVLIAGALLLRRAQHGQSRLSPAEREAMIARVRAALRHQPEADHADA